MNELFGIPVADLALVLVALLAVVLAVVATLALRNKIFLRLGVRSVTRRRGRSALIVLGLMLGTTIIAAALATGDTMSQTIRSAALTALGRTDEVVAAKGIDTSLGVGAAGTSTRYFPAGYADRVAAGMRGTGLVDAVEPVIVDGVAVLGIRSRQSEPRVTLFASDPARMARFGAIRSEGRTVSLADLRPGEVYVNAKAADKLDVRTGERIRILYGSRSLTARVRAVVSYSGAASPDEGVLLSLAQAQRLVGRPGLIDGIFVANVGGVGATDRVMAALKPVLTPLGLEADNTRQDALDAADTMGTTFMSFFTTFGSFSIAAGILLIFLIFVMLAAERRGEMGIARAVGTRRGHLVQMFVYEGLAYDLAAAAIGALLGVGVAYGMVLVMASAFAMGGDFHMAYSVKPASIVLAYALGVLLTFAVVAVSAWRVSRMNIVSAIRALPDPAHEKTRRRWVLGLVGVALGLLVAWAAVKSEDGVSLGVGVSLVILGLIPVARRLGATQRAARTVAGLALVVWFVLPISRWLFGDLKVNFSIFVFGGLMIVVGASWAIMENAGLLLRGLSATVGRAPRAAPVLRMAMAYPLRSLFRTGVTLTMFTLVVFTLVVGATTTGSFVNGANDISAFGGGFDVRATASPSSPIRDMRTSLARAGLPASDFRVVSNDSVLPVKARQLGTDRKPESYLLAGADAAFLSHTTYGLAATARGYDSPAAVWHALRDRRGLAVVDQFVVPRKTNWGFGPMPKFHLSGFYLEDKTFDPPKVTVRDPQTGKHVTLTVIGVLSDRAPQMMAGIWTSQRTLAPVFGDRVDPTVHLFALRHGVDAKATAQRLEASFLPNGMQADSLRKLLDDVIAGSLTFDRLIEGFMGLGLIVGVAALGVISARAVVERRQQIGVLRAIGFSKRAVQAIFLIESSFVALTSIVVGSGLGLLVAHNVIADARRTPSWEGMSFQVPWLTLLVIFFTVYVVALLTTLAPARRASRIFPAQALRYQ